MMSISIDNLLTEVLKAYDVPFTHADGMHYLLSEVKIDDDGSVTLVGTVQIDTLWDEIESVDQGRTNFPFVVEINHDGKIKLILPDEIPMEHRKEMVETYERIKDPVVNLGS